MNPESLTLTTSVAGATAIIAAYSFVADWFFCRHGRIDQRLKEEFDVSGRMSDGSLSIFKQVSAEELAGQQSLRARLYQFVEQSGLPITPARLLEIAAISAAVAGLAMCVAGPHWLLAIPAATAAAAVPFLFVRYKRRQRIERLSNQLPEAFELMSRAVRAGQTMAAAFRLVANESQAPISTEFKHCFEQQDLGLSQEVTYRELARRNGVMELQMFVVALLVQRQTGGSPVELLNNLSHMVRKRIRMKGKVKALTGEGRMQAIVLSVLPLLAFAAIYFLKRSYAQTLLDRPALLIGTAAAAVLGSLWVRKIVNFDY